MYEKNTSPFPIHHLQLSNGYKLAYIDEGAGDKTIIFVHGLGNYAQVWKKNIADLKQHYRCIAIDLPGNGYSDRAEFSHTMNFYAGCIKDFIVKMGLKNICLAGHSMGGQVILTLLLNEPGIASHVILCAPAGFETFTPFEGNMYSSTLSMFDIFSTEENSIRQSIRSSFYQFPHQEEEMIEELVAMMKRYPVKLYRQMLDSGVRSMLNEPVFNRLHEITQPVLVMFGERDALIPNRMIHPVTTRNIAEQGTKRMPNALLKMIPQCGHFLQIEKAHAVNTYIKDFLC